VKLIPLTQGKFAQVDDTDYDLVSAYAWHYKEGYAATNMFVCGKRTTVRMHRFIMSASEAEEVDHEDRDKLNNRRYNLRRCGRGPNCANRDKWGDVARLFKGVYPSGNKWIALIRSNKVGRYLGSFTSQEAAARAYDNAAVEAHGEFARLNFPQEVQCSSMR